MNLTKKLTTEEYISRVYNIVGEEYSILGKYIDTKTKILTRHNYCGNKWKISPNKFLLGRRCPKCQIEKVASLRRSSYVKLNRQTSKTSNGSVDLIGGEYVNQNSVMNFFCKSCNQYFSMKMVNFLTSKGCPFCVKKEISKRMRKTNDDFLEELFEKFGEEYVSLEKYVKSSVHILVRHTPCGESWKVTPNNLLRGFGCPKCGLEKRIKSQTKNENVFSKEVYEIGKGEYVLVGKYVNNLTKVAIKHVTCGNVIYMTPGNFLNGRRCFYCSSSRGEFSIYSFLSDNHIPFVQEYSFSDCKYKSLLWFDFYLKEYNLCIEYQGAQHYKPYKFFGGEESFKEQIIRDKIKEKYCRKNNINLLRIPYWEFENIEEILEQTLSDLR